MTSTDLGGNRQPARDSRRWPGVVLAGLVMLWLLAAACAPADEGDPNDGIPVDVPPIVEDEPAAYHPFTGIPTDDPDAFFGRPFMIIIDNHPRARPATGLSAAQVVYEVPVEGDYTRFTALYHPLPDGAIGPVRSVRPYVVEWLREWDAILVHAGGSPEAMGMLSQGGDARIDSLRSGAVFFRGQSRAAPHNLYVTASATEASAAQRGWLPAQAPAPRLTFLGRDLTPSETPWAQGLAYQVEIPSRLAPVRWDMSFADQSYRRFMLGLAHDDADGTPIARQNVVILQAPVQRIPGDPEGRLRIDVTSGGSAWLVRSGAYWQGSWRQGAGGLELRAADGRPLALAPGTTWIHLLPEGQEPTFSAPPPAGGAS